MTAIQWTFSTTLILSAVLASAAVPPAVAQSVVPHGEGLHQTERKVIILRSEGGPRINLQAIGGNRGFLGVGLLDLTPELRSHFGVPEDRGIMVSTIVDGSPAERAGLRPADILTAADGDPLPTSIDLSLKVARAAEGSEVELELWRSGQRDVIRVPVEVRPRSQLDISPLFIRRLEVEGGRRIEVEAVGDTGLGPRWIEDVVETIGDSFSQVTFIQQLEALRRERNGLLEKLQQMEVRLEKLEGELHLLDPESR